MIYSIIAIKKLVANAACHIIHEKYHSNIYPCKIKYILSTKLALKNQPQRTSISTECNLIRQNYNRSTNSSRTD